LQLLTLAGFLAVSVWKYNGTRMFDGTSNIVVISSEYIRSYLYFKDILLPVYLLNSSYFNCYDVYWIWINCKYVCRLCLLVLVGVMMLIYYIFVLCFLRYTDIWELRSPYVDGICLYYWLIIDIFIWYIYYYDIGTIELLFWSVISLLKYRLLLHTYMFIV